MDFKEFWMMVEKHPWLPRILTGWGGLKDWQKDPCVIGDFLNPSQIREVIGYIAFSPWESLDQSSMHQSRSLWRKCDDGSILEIISGVDYGVFWHGDKEVQFTNALLIQKNKNADQNIRQIIERIVGGGGVVDLVVRIKTQYCESTPDNRGKTEPECLMEAVFRDFCFTSSYELYLPPK